MNIYYQGIDGAYSEEAILTYFQNQDTQPTPQPAETFTDLFHNIDKHGLGMVPIENSNAGSVSECYDLFFKHPDLTIIGEYYMPIQHCLLTKKQTTLQNITTVISHPQALAQCDTFLHKHNLQTKKTYDTAGAAKELQTKKDTVAAIASKTAAHRYNLTILTQNIQNRNDNTTRFLLTKNQNKTYQFETSLDAPTKTTLLFQTRHIPAALYKALGGFATNNINLSKIESRPKRDGEQFEPIFFLDAESPLNTENMQKALDELRHFSEDLRIIGTYPTRTE